MSHGPLTGVRVIEVASLGPGPFACMMLADMGADVLRLERGEGSLGSGSWNAINRGRPSVGIDIKHPEGRAVVDRLAASADAFVEGFRPGVMERLGLGPDALLATNPALIYARMTGYGQQGPLCGVAGHDINYISIAGVLGAIRRKGQAPLAPLSLVGDFGGGGMLLAFGITCALLEARSSGRGQVIDAAMVDGSALLATATYSLRAAGMWEGAPGTNAIDSGSHWYETYETADGEHIAVGALEPEFYAELLRQLGVEPHEFPQWDRDRWPEFKQRLAEVFRTRTRDEWTTILESADACATPVLSLEEAPSHPHNVARGTFVELNGVMQPAPAPRFSRTPGAVRCPPSEPGADTARALADWGLDSSEIDRLAAAGALGQRPKSPPGVGVPGQAESRSAPYRRAPSSTSLHRGVVT